ncbi:segregation and condensation protein A [Streptomyces hoynatensis]|uniref:Segregation and condensation protein A n=1 Tax=Streptomyces hoynatensis TaxID=1141874 RepID=A0A3A9Z603_9ACTN|nr:segregation/condensation protein A [Streptomyces hoynatensis]RKN43723.1 segregation/condensation protein A [Streptomyces hoynatensis]
MTPPPARRPLGRGPGTAPAAAPGAPAAPGEPVPTGRPAPVPQAPAAPAPAAPGQAASPSAPPAPAAPERPEPAPERPEPAPERPEPAPEGPVSASGAPSVPDGAPRGDGAREAHAEGRETPADPGERAGQDAGNGEGAGDAPDPGEGAAGDRGAKNEGEGEDEGEDEVEGEAGGDGEAGADDGRFRVVLENFEGPFDLLLQLISRHKLDVTEVALSRVTDDFMAHIRAMGPDWDLDQTTEFLVVAATLLDLKAARLLPAAEVEDEADLALLEARDLLFARLLQYRAFKRVAAIFEDRLAAEALRHPRTVGLEPHHAELLPEVVISIGAEGFARLAVKAMQPKPPPQVYVDHIHAPLVSVREQAKHVIGLLRLRGEASFAELTEDAPDTLTVVARFLALLELYRERAVALDQEEALGTLIVRWQGAEPGRPLVTDEFDQESRPQPEEERR